METKLKLILKPSGFPKLLSLFSGFVSISISISFLASEWRNLSKNKCIIFSTITLAIILITIDFYQRIMIIEPKLLRVRFLWIWREYHFPPHVMIHINSASWISVIDRDTLTLLARFSPFKGRPKELVEQIDKFYQECNRSSFVTVMYSKL